MNDGGVCRTALAPPGLLIALYWAKEAILVLCKWKKLGYQAYNQNILNWSIKSKKTAQKLLRHIKSYKS